ncbi:LHFPL tetraspan subfamily member 3 protein [Phymastichus coffea]|uniref:LHFPL tetraspan subfamily member 3 protein n=1 Tax=Phymastichus coffea TaxID=108790 RepID=UPI00273B5CD0|nr:LHFPL tetraspan subfamily member 3 protein [Phymastichus coffea]XP_058802095.1 LHFPL tetraspan subfamily member 3 protein [Phymastichus coffea]
MGSKVEYVESSHMYATNYIRNSKAIGVLWAIFTICYAIIGVVAFITPEWLGDLEHENPGRFGLWMRCSFGGTGELVEECVGRLDELSSIASVPFRASTILVGIAVIIALASILTMTLFFFCQSTTVFYVCGWMQVVSAVCMGVGVCVYPLGWDSPLVRAICGAAATRYNPGACAIRWAIPLASIAALDAATLAALAFILASRHVKLQPEPFNNGSLYKGEVNAAYVNEAQSVAGSRKSLSLRPVLLVAPPDQDRYSELSRAKSHSHHSLFAASQSHPVHAISTNTLNHSHHNFQL